MNEITILLAGAAGMGIEAMTHSLALAFAREGLHVFTTSEYENRIRGGHGFGMVRVADVQLTSHRDQDFDICIAMNKESISWHMDEIKSGGVIIYDGEKTTVDDLTLRDDVTLVSVPIKTLAKEAGLELAANVVAVGAALGILERSPEKMKTVLKNIFDHKGEEVVQVNYNALESGYTYAQEHSDIRIPFTTKGDTKTRFLMTGNEAIALGCIKAGLKFLAAYPMTPGSTIMTTLAKESREYDVVVSHVEDEIAAVNMAIGAGYAGVRAATSTSGGGFALMGEAVGFASMIEAPVVIFNAQRPGPSTGLPTRTGQGDLRMAMHCGQGDFPRLVVAAGDHYDCIHLTAEAFNLAERFQLPVIFLTEKYLADSYQTCSYAIADGVQIDRGKLEMHPNEGFLRYQDTPDGVSPRSVPGVKNGMYTATSYEHNEEGKAREEVVDVEIMMEKRWRKMTSLEEALPAPKVYVAGVEIETESLTGKNVLFLWGASKGPALEAQQILKSAGIEVVVVQMQFIHPFKKEVVKKLFQEVKTLVCVEGNQSGQLEGILLEHTGIAADRSIRLYYGRPMTGVWIAEEVKKLYYEKSA